MNYQLVSKINDGEWIRVEGAPILSSEDLQDFMKQLLSVAVTMNMNYNGNPVFGMFVSPSERKFISFEEVQ